MAFGITEAVYEEKFTMSNNTGCPTANCRIPDYVSLGVCANCESRTMKLEKDSPFCNYTIDSADWDDPFDGELYRGEDFENFMRSVKDHGVGRKITRKCEIYEEGKIPGKMLRLELTWRFVSDNNTDGHPVKDVPENREEAYTWDGTFNDTSRNIFGSRSLTWFGDCRVNANQHNEVSAMLRMYNAPISDPVISRCTIEGLKYGYNLSNNATTIDTLYCFQSTYDIQALGNFHRVGELSMELELSRCSVDVCYTT